MIGAQALSTVRVGTALGAGVAAAAWMAADTRETGKQALEAIGDKELPFAGAALAGGITALRSSEKLLASRLLLRSPVAGAAVGIAGAALAGAALGGAAGAVAGSTLLRTDHPRPAADALRGATSLIPAGTKGPAGEEYVGRAVTDAPRVYVGVNSAPSIGRRVQMAVDELERVGGFDKERVIVMSPTGTGWVNPVPAETAERLDPDAAFVTVSFGDKPSLLSWSPGSLNRGSTTQTELVNAVLRRKQELHPEGGGPEVMVWGESIGAGMSQRGILNGDVPLDQIRAAYVGTPGVTRHLATEFPGQAREFTGAAQVRDMTPAESAPVRAWDMRHEDDPVSNLNFRSIVRRPDGPQGEGWQPVVSFAKTAAAVPGAIAETWRPGMFDQPESHDYRGDIPEFLYRAFGYDQTVAPDRLAETRAAIRERWNQ